MIIETHFHLDYLKAKSPNEIIADAKGVGVEKFITISVDPKNIDHVLKLAQEYSEVYCSQGIHPHDAKDASDELIRDLSRRAKLTKVVAIGEIGLDYYYNHSPREIQIKRFEEQLQVASETDLPVIIHSRDADEDMINILKSFAPKLKRKGVIHSFSSTLELAQNALNLDFYLGFNGMVTFKNAQNVKDAVSLCPVDKLLFETDSPFLSPVPHRGKENSPANLPFIISEIAKIKDIDESELRKQVYQNSQELFF